MEILYFWKMKLLLSAFLLFPLLLFSQSFEKGEKLYNEGKYSLAQPYFENYLKSNPNHFKTLEYLGDIASYNKAWDKSVVYYKKLKQLKPSEANFFFKYGAAMGMKAKESNKLKALGMIGEIRRAFEKTIELNPKHIEARWGLMYYYMYLPGIFGGSETKAIRFSNELLKLSPVDGYLSRGQLDEYFERYTLAEEQFKKAIAAGSTKKGAQFLSNLYKNKMNQPEKAAKIKI